MLPPLSHRLSQQFSHKLSTVSLNTAAIASLVFMGVLFYSSYGLTNWLAHERVLWSDIAEIHFDWERSIPFLAWTIVPYWSLNLFYVGAFFVCRSKKQLFSLVVQLVIAQAIAAFFFVVAPLQFTGQKPVVTGFFGWLFEVLLGFDLPYNQAPSLHIILVVVLCHFYWHRVHGVWRACLLAWFVLIALSVLTTYQHHFVDIPSGLMVGVLVLWLCPTNDQGASQSVTPLHQWVAQHLPDVTWRHQQLARRYAVASLLVLMSGVWAFGWLFGGLVMLWPALALAWVGLNYRYIGASGFQKQHDGKMSFAAWVWYLPYRLAVRLNIEFWLRQQPKFRELYPLVAVGSICSAEDFVRVLDLCAEYPCPDLSPARVASAPIAHNRVFCLPILDLVAPSAASLRMAAIQLQHFYAQATLDQQPVLVACALGYSRSVAVVLTWSLLTGREPDWQAAYQRLQHTHPRAVVTADMQDVIIKAAYEERSLG